MAESAGPGRRLRAWAGSGLSPGVGPVAFLHLLPSSFPSARRAPGGAAGLSCSSCFCGLTWDPTHPRLPPAALISANLPSSCKTFLAQGSSAGRELQCQCHHGHAAQCRDNQGCLHTRLAPDQGRTTGAGERQRPLLFPPLEIPPSLRHLAADESAMGAAPGACRAGAIGPPAQGLAQDRGLGLSQLLLPVGEALGHFSAAPLVGAGAGGGRPGC